MAMWYFILWMPDSELIIDSIMFTSFKTNYPKS
jgi:hypothetical protein